MARALLTILVFGLIMGAVSLGVGKAAGLGWQIGFMPVATAGGALLGLWLRKARRG